MNAYLKWFSIVVWIGILVNLYFAVPALFVPEYLINTLDLEPDFNTVWLRNTGLLIFLISFYNVAAALAPARYPAIPWLVIGGRFLAAIYWLIVVLDVLHTSSNPGAFLPFLIGDLTFGTIKAILLYIGLRRLWSQP